MRGSRRSPIAVAYQWASVSFTVSLEMILPAVGGIFLDERLGTKPWLLFVGAAIGLMISIVHLTQLTKTKSDTKTENESDTTS